MSSSIMPPSDPPHSACPPLRISSTRPSYLAFSRAARSSSALRV
eukprot:CAMPEP_0173244464 /NCGR_PEP_ID=MMETSP1142-20121109/16111_1 /TAXON_ID=483371 /ORGANISM="non described non described, Strain CCMP2298" /LENGTH=43 /DNA_ID= /DNA_START= /DNA_END= /DNA_ORIENTATION=